MYTQAQIDAVRNRALLHGVSGDFPDSVCIEYLDWYFANKKEYISKAEAVVDSLINGSDYMKAERQKLIELAHGLTHSP